MYIHKRNILTNTSYTHIHTYTHTYIHTYLHTYRPQKASLKRQNYDQGGRITTREAWCWVVPHRQNYDQGGRITTWEPPRALSIFVALAINEASYCTYTCFDMIVRWEYRFFWRCVMTWLCNYWYELCESLYSATWAATSGDTFTYVHKYIFHLMSSRYFSGHRLWRLMCGTREDAPTDYHYICS